MYNTIKNLKLPNLNINNYYQEVNRNEQFYSNML